MEYSVEHDPVFSILKIDMNEGDSVEAQPNSMVSMTSGIQISATVGRSSNRGFSSGFKSLLGGENFFTSQYKAAADEQKLMLAPDAIGDILTLDMKELGPFYLTRGSYLANVGDCKLSIKYGGVKGLMSKKGLFLLHASGEGTVFCQCYGAIARRELEDGEKFFVDNRFVVAFSETVQYQLVKATDSVKDSLMSGEGLVNRYTGPGSVFYQTRGKPGVGLLSRLFDAAF